MNPLDATTAEALFGEAVSDPRALKRAYAKLIREFGPETHPEVFQHIRALYEAASAGGAGGAGGSGGEGVGSVERGGPAEHGASAGVEGATPVDTAARVDTVLLRLETDGLDAVLAALAELAAQADAPAIVAQVLLVYATRPAEVEALVTRHLGAPRTCMIVGPVAQRLLTHDYDNVGGETVRRWIDAAVDRRVAAELVMTWLDVLLYLERPNDAWVAWEEEEARILAATPERWAGLFGRVLFAAGWTLPEAELVRWEARLHSAGLPIEERVFELLRRTFGDIRALKAAESSPETARTVEILRGLGNATPTAHAVGLAVLAAEPWALARLEAMAQTAPGVYAIVARRLESLSHRDAVAWAQARGEAVRMRVADGAVVDAGLPGAGWATAERERQVALAIKARAEGQGRVTAGFLTLVATVVGLVVNLDTSHTLGWGGVLWTVVILLELWGVILLDRRFQRQYGPHPSLRLKQGDAPWVVAAADQLWQEAAPIRRWCRAEGLWLHEAHHLLTRDDEMADIHLGHPLSDLQVIGLHHIRRTLERT